MTESATGIILRTRALTETSLIVHWLTAGQGRIATVAKGARRPKSTFAGKLDLFYAADFQFQPSRRSDLHTLREVGLRDTHPALRRELGWLQQAAYAATLVEQTTETGTPLPEIYALFAEFLAHLPGQSPKPRSIFAFELKLLRELGLEPDAAEINLPPATQQLIAALTETPFAGLAALRATAAQAVAVRQFLHGFLIYHLGKFPKARASVVQGS
ncbi:MAG: repair protein RecO [Verrucomicrobiota bacterium]|jgi:DNA repair protein RecO (recombination protein O)